MANFTATTVTETSAQITDRNAIEELLEEYRLPNIDVEFRGDDENELVMHGYGSFQAFLVDEEGDIFGKTVTNEFLYRLSTYIAEGETLDIRTVGNTKLRHVTATRRVVTQNQVKTGGLDTGLATVSPPTELAEVMDEASLNELPQHA